MIEAAKQFAEDAHDGQRRKFEGRAYVEHPKEVAEIVQSVADPTDEMVAAALLHDVVEDTSVDLPEIEEEFGTEVASLVFELTTDKEKRDEYGKARYLGYKMAQMSEEALTLKLCDRYCNVRTIEETPDEFCNRYSEETMETINLLIEDRSDMTRTQRELASKIIKKVQWA